MAHILTQKQIDEFKECFTFYDKPRKGVIRQDDLSTVMRSLGTSPTVPEIKDYLKKYNRGDGYVHFDDFLMMMHLQLQREDPAREILAAFRNADKQGRGFIMATEFKHIMTRFGEKLSDREVENLMKETGIQKNGFVVYEDFLKRILQPPPDKFSS